MLNLSDYIFDDHIICPICNKSFRSLNIKHLRMHGYDHYDQFRKDYDLPMTLAFVCADTLQTMRDNALTETRKKRWQKVSKIGHEMAAKQKVAPIVSRESRLQGWRSRGNDRTWVPDFVQEMTNNGWLDLHKAAEIMGISYNYARKISSDGRLRTEYHKNIRFTKPEWIDSSLQLLEENRRKHRPDLLVKGRK